MDENYRTSAWKGRLLDRLVHLTIAEGLNPELAKAGTKMHKLVDFFEPPTGYIGRLRTIQTISDLTIGDTQLTSVCRPLAAWRPYVDFVLAAPESFAKKLNLTANGRTEFLAETEDDPLRSQGLKRHALEGVLWPAFKATDEKKYLKNLLLQGQMTTAQVSILTVEFSSARSRPGGVPDEDVYKYLYGPCLSARGFSRTEWAEALESIPLVIDPIKYVQALEELLVESKKAEGAKFCGVEKKKYRDALGSISAFIARGIEQRKFHKRKRDGNGPNKGGPVSVTTIAVGADGDSSTESAAAVAEIVTRTRGIPEEREELDRAGECPEDHLPRRQFILTTGGPRVAEHVRAAYDRANQLLPNRYPEPHPGEFALLIQAMNSERGHFASRRDQVELIAWTESLFWLSCSPAQATNLLVGLPETPLPAAFDFFIRIDSSQGADAVFVPRTCIRVIEPPYLTEYVPIPGERDREKWFEIPDLGGLSCPIRDLLDELKSSGGSPGLLMMHDQAVKIFAESEDTYTKRLSAFVESAGLRNSISATELGKILFQRMKEARDIVSADLLTCKDYELAKVRRWYFTPQIEHLRTVHERAVASIATELSQARWDRPISTNRLPKDERYVGSRRCIDLQFLKDSVGTLWDIVEEVVAVKTDKDRRQVFTEKHNALTVLAVWAIDICIGMRATTHLYLHRSQYDPKTGYGSILEKGKARAFQICEGARLIAGQYDNYIDGLVEYGLPRPNRKMPCYFLKVVGERLEIFPVTPSSLKELLRSLFRFDANWARRLVKTMAIEQGIPGIYTDNFCGHGYRGEERHHPFGSFDPVPYFYVMTAFTEDILKKITLTPERFDPSVLEPCA